jgi:hypothetical protein
MSDLWTSDKYNINSIDKSGSTYELTITHANNDVKLFTVLKDALIDTVPTDNRSVTQLDESSFFYDIRDRQVRTANTFTATTISNASSNTGSGLSINFSVTTVSEDIESHEVTIINPGSGYYVGEVVNFDPVVLGGLPDQTCSVIITSVSNSINYFPTGLLDADVIANALPMINVEHGVS